MLVGHQDAVQGLRRASNGGQALADLPPAEAGVNQQPGFPGFQVGAITRGTATQDGEPCRHWSDVRWTRCESQWF